MRNFVFLLLFTLFSTQAISLETCSRTAVINYQEVLVDTNSNQKGEGLRYYLEKDSISKEYLDKYQDGSMLRWYQAIPGSIGTGLILAGIMNSGSNGRRSLMIGGGVLIAVNFLIAKTLEAANEENLSKAINEYNKRNLPIIHFNPEGGNDKSSEPSSPSILINYSRSF